MENKTINQNWLKARNEQIQKEKEENSKYLKLKIGENIIKIDLTQLPIEETKTISGKAVKRFVYQTEINNNGRKMLLSASAYLDTLIIKALSEGFNPFTLIKTGEGINTRYAVKELSGE
jgi:hypothetical protein